MASRLTKIVADFQTSLATLLAVGATTGSLIKVKDDDNVSLPTGNYFFTIDGNNSNKEHICCTLSGTTISSIKSVSRQGVQTSGVARVHRVGAQVVLTDFAIIKEITNLLDGTYALDGSNPLIYDTDPAITDGKHLATKKYMDSLALAGAPIATASTLGIAKMSCAPADANNPIAVGTNDTRIPTAGEAAALVGTDGTPSAANPFVTSTDPALTNNVKTSGDQTVAGVKTFNSIPVLPASDATTANQAVRKAQIDALVGYSSGSVSGGTGTTIYYQKIGKTYFGFTIVDTTHIQGNGYACPLYNDANTRGKIMSLLGKTEASNTSLTIYGSNQGTSLGGQWTGSAWQNTQLGNVNSESFLLSITVT